MRRVILLLTLCVGCAPAEPDISIRMTEMEGERTITAALSVTDGNGDAVELTKDNTIITVNSRPQGGAWVPAADVDVRFGGPSRIDTVVVADNSGSVLDELETIQDALRGFTHVMLAGSQNDRLGIIRVSTEANVHRSLTTDKSELNAGIDELFVNRGWTALYDGIRIAHEELTDASVVATGNGNKRFCVDGSYLAAVVFTDGEENNSADENPTQYPGDGIDTTLADLLAIEVRGVKVPIFTVGVGDEIDAPVLETLAADTGGDFRRVDHYRQLKGALESAAASMRRSIPVCFDPASCDDVEAQLTVTVNVEEGSVTNTFLVDLPQRMCPGGR